MVSTDHPPARSVPAMPAIRGVQVPWADDNPVLDVVMLLAIDRADVVTIDTCMVDSIPSAATTGGNQAETHHGE